MAMGSRKIKAVVVALGIMALPGCFASGKTPIDYLPTKFIPCPTEAPEDKSLPWPKEEFEAVKNEEDLVQVAGPAYEAYTSKDKMLKVWKSSWLECSESVKEGKKPKGWFSKS